MKKKKTNNGELNYTAVTAKHRHMKQSI